MTYISPEQHKHKLRMQYLRDSKKDPVYVPIGYPGHKRTTLSEAELDREVEYEIDKDQRLVAEVNQVEQRKHGRKTSNELVDEAQRQRALTMEAHTGQRWIGQERWQGQENVKARMVNVMHCREFVRRLARVGIHVWLNNFSKLGRIGVNARVLEFDDLGRGIGMVNKTVTTLQYPWSYEWSVMRFNEFNVPTQEKFRGWRTALLVLISRGVCTEAQGHEAMGKPLGLASLFYREMLYNFRNLKGVYEKPVAASLPKQDIKPKGRKKKHDTGQLHKITTAAAGLPRSTSSRRHRQHAGRNVRGKKPGSRGLARR